MRAPSQAVASEWAVWRPHECAADYTVGIEEEVMLLNPHDWSLAPQVDRVLASLPPDLVGHVASETHTSAVELGTGVHAAVPGARMELERLRRSVEGHLMMLGLRAAAAGTHPMTVWQETVVSSGDRYQQVYGSMRELARREPSFAQHVHVGIRDPDDAIRLAGRMRGHLPMLLALSANSPFWQGRDSGLASVRTPLFQAFPRVGIPRAFSSYEEYVCAVGLLIETDAIAEPTFLWWDVRPQPRFGTVEVRIMDAQTTVEETTALAALVQCLARLEIEEPYLDDELLAAPEVLDENRFIAARDGMEASLIDTARRRRMPVRELVPPVLEACGDHARDLGCSDELEAVKDLVERPPAARQLELARQERHLPGLVKELADLFSGEALSRSEA